MHCAACGAENQPGKNYCVECGAVLPKACPSCGSPIGSSDKFCGHCGTGLSPSAASAATAIPLIPPTTAEAAGERRQLTVMFVDLIGSTELSTRLDPEDLREVLAAYHSMVAEVVRDQGGYVAQYLGDGALVYFGYPASHEDDAERSIKAALALIERTKGLIIQGADVRIRIGIATGLVVVGDKAVGSDAAHEPRIMGETPNLAARLQGRADPQSIVIAESTRQLVGGLFAYKSMGSLELKGLSRPITAWEVLGATGIDDRFTALRSEAAPFIGREEELELLLRRWRQAAEHGGKAVLVSGEAGLGKSRLLAVARDMFAADDPEIISYFCSANLANTALHPIIRQIQRSCDLTPNDTQGTRRGKLEGLLGALSTPEALALLADLLSTDRLADPEPIAHLSPAERRKATFDLLVRHLASLAATRRLAIVFEDIHWADPSTLELLDLLITQIETHPILLIATYRSEFQAAWAGLAQVSVVTLTRLEPNQRRRLIEAVAGPGRLSPELIEEIAERTDGVPLFAEELTKATAEAESERGGGETILRKAARGSAIPATLHASLMARLDRLGPTARNVAQTGAVIGREFSHELLSCVWSGSPGEMDTALEQLCTAGLVFARGAGDQANYQFKHALVLDAAYSTLLRGQKQALHRAVAEHLSNRSEAGNVAELIARHYREAQEFHQAAEWRLRAGEISNQHSAHREAVENLREGLTDAASLPETTERTELELKLNIALTIPLIALFAFTSPQATEVVERAESLSRALGKPRPATLLFHRWLIHYARSEHDVGVIVARELETSMKSHPLGLRGWSCRLLSEINRGYDLVAAREEFTTIFDKLLSIGPEFDNLRFTSVYDLKAVAGGGLCLTLLQTGYPDQALRVCEVGLKRAREIRHPMSICSVLFWKMMSYEVRGDLVSLENCARECLDIGRRENLAAWPQLASIFLGLVNASKGDVEGGLALVDGALDWLDKVRFKIGRPYHLVLRANILDIAKRGTEALATIEQGIRVAQEINETITLALLRYHRGDLLIHYRGAEAVCEAEQEFRHALGIAREQNGLRDELLASHGLANVMRRRGNAAGALQLLEPLFDRFTEGFDTADLIAAKSTIDELKGQLEVPQQLAAS